MATTKILLISARSALKSTFSPKPNPFQKCLSTAPPETGATEEWTGVTLSQILGRSNSSKIPQDLLDWESGKRRPAFELTDDIVNSERKLHALFRKWLSTRDYYHFDVEDRKAFNERFEIFKARARFCHYHNKRGRSSVGINCFADLTDREAATCSWTMYPKKADQVISRIFSRKSSPKS